MKILKIDKKTRESLIEIFKTKNISLEGNILKIIDPENDEAFSKYIDDALQRDKDTRKKRLEMTRQIQAQNAELLQYKEDTENYQIELKNSMEKLQDSFDEANRLKSEADQARVEAEKSREDAEKAKSEAISAKNEAENAKQKVENDLDILQKKTQNELIGVIVKVALIVIASVGLLVTGVYLISIFTGKDTEVIASTWSNIVGILLTNAFSIIGTIMGVKYASSEKG